MTSPLHQEPDYWWKRLFSTAMIYYLLVGFDFAALTHVASKLWTSFDVTAVTINLRYPLFNLKAKMQMPRCGRNCARRLRG